MTPYGGDTGSESSLWLVGDEEDASIFMRVERVWCSSARCLGTAKQLWSSLPLLVSSGEHDLSSALDGDSASEQPEGALGPLAFPHA